MDWYKDKNLFIEFSTKPIVIERYIVPYYSEIEKKEILKKPYKNLKDLTIKIKYSSKCKSSNPYPPESHTFTIPRGYCFDGASIPRIFWRLIGANTDNTFIIASMVHDYICENHNTINHNRYLSTLIFNALLEQGGVKAPKRWLMKHCVDNWQKVCRW